MPRRSGLSLVELLVALGLTLFILVILIGALGIGLESFGKLKALGDLNARLRGASALLRRDLAADHFEGRRRLSDSGFWAQGPPREGFFRIWQGGPGIPEGSDIDGIPSTRATNHLLHFTIKLRGNRREDFLSARVPAGSPLLTARTTFFDQPADARHEDAPSAYTSQWAEVAYFLRRSGASAGPMPLYALYRRQRLIVPDNGGLNWPSAVPVAEAADYAEMSCQLAPARQGLYFNNPADLTVPQRRFGMNPDEAGGLPVVRPGWPGLNDPDVTDDPATWTYPTLAEEFPALAGNDLLLADVLSFEVKVLQPSATDFDDVPAGSTNPLFDELTPPRWSRPRVFDTWSSLRDNAYDYSRWNAPSGRPTTVPQRIVVAAVRVTLRAWDAKTGQARQVTIVQEM